MFTANYFWYWYSYTDGRELEITSLLEYSTQSSRFAIRCTTVGSPPTTLLWRRNGILLGNSSVFASTQLLLDASLASYDNVLMIQVDDNLDSVIGTYECYVENRIDVDRKDLIFEGRGERVSYFFHREYFCCSCICL